jgi:hypothetical protein
VGEGECEGQATRVHCSAFSDSRPRCPTYDSMRTTWHARSDLLGCAVGSSQYTCHFHPEQRPKHYLVPSVLVPSRRPASLLTATSDPVLEVNMASTPAAVKSRLRACY